MRTRPSIVAAAFLALSAFAVPALAWDARTAAKEIGRLNLEALELYDTLDFEGAKAKLGEALKLADKEGLTEDQVVARTHLHLGAVLIVGYKENAKGLAEIQKALRIDTGVKM